MIFFFNSRARSLFKKFLIFVIFLFIIILYKNKPTVSKYEKFNKRNLVEISLSNEVLSGLSISNQTFRLNDKPFMILSGSIHYFRIHPQYWLDRLLRLKHSGLNTVSSYVPWNLHQKCHLCELDFSYYLDLKMFLRLAYDNGLFVILRPGPYICAEFDFGGFPSWLLSTPNMTLRSTFNQYLKFVENYLQQLFKEIKDMQYTASMGGSIIAFQIENEYASYYPLSDLEQSMRYMKFVRDTMRRSGATEFFFTSDGTSLHKEERVRLVNQYIHQVAGAVNFQNNPRNALKALHDYQYWNPGFVGEFWGGWFDHWGPKSSHSKLNVPDFEHNFEIIIQSGASFNIYMFHGGTNFGFSNGANVVKPKQESSPISLDGLSNVDYIYAPTTTSYDYDAAVSENGGLTDKYFAIREVIADYLDIIPPDSILNPLPPLPPNIVTSQYDTLKVNQLMDLETMLKFVPEPLISSEVLYIEDIIRLVNEGKFSIDGVGNSRRKGRKGGRNKAKRIKGIKRDTSDRQISIISGFGYILYRAPLINSNGALNVIGLTNPGIKLKFEYPVSDRADIYWYKQYVATIDVNAGSNQTVRFLDQNVMHSNEGDKRSAYLDILVENMGRINYNYYSDVDKMPSNFKIDQQKKGLNGNVTLQGIKLNQWLIYPLDFNEQWLESLPRNLFFDRLMPESVTTPTVPALFRTTLDLTGNMPRDTFVDFEGWQKGCIFVNNFNLGRYWNVGPQFALYLPAPLLTSGINEILIWETEKPGDTISFSDKPMFREISTVY